MAQSQWTTVVATHSIIVTTFISGTISDQLWSGCVRATSVSLGCKICDNCRKKLAKLPTTPKVSSSSELESESEVYAHASESLASLNQCLDEIGETSVSKQKLQRNNYPKQKIKLITTAMKKVMLLDQSLDESDDEGEITKQLKERFHATTKKVKGSDSNYSAKKLTA